MVASKTELPRYTCKRCGHGWVPRRDVRPTVCPKCKSPYWDRVPAPYWKRGMIRVQPAG